MERIIKREELFDLFLKDADADFKGWDFSYVTKSGRVKEFPLSWNYTNEIMSYLNKVTSLLDMGTGGGEYLSSLKRLPEFVCATEGYEPNIDIAKNRLEPLGIKIYSISDDDNLPFENDSFELIINRHEAFSPHELMRILKPKGIFITQQVGGLNYCDLNNLLGAEEYIYSDWNLEIAINQLSSSGFNVLKHGEDMTKSRFYDIGAVIYCLKAIPWQVTDFSIDKYYDKLINIHNIISEEGHIDFTCHRFLVIAQK